MCTCVALKLKIGCYAICNTNKLNGTRHEEPYIKPNYPLKVSTRFDYLMVYYKQSYMYENCLIYMCR